MLDTGFDTWEHATKAFMTTDMFPKLRSRVFFIDGVQYHMARMDKGAGMIHPDMGPASTLFPPALPRQLHTTLLGCILTDAAVSPRSLQSVLTYAVDRSFNSISVDMSTNDAVLLLANGAVATSASTVVKEIDEESDRAAYDVFKHELMDFAIEVAQLVVRDGKARPSLLW